MSSHLSSTDISRYGTNSVTASEALEWDDHLSRCEKCRSRFVDRQQLETTYRFVKANLESAGEDLEFHLASEHMASYVDGGLDPEEREIIHSHLQVCPECERDIDDLMRLRDAIASDKSERKSGSFAMPLIYRAVWQRRAFRIGIEVLVVALISTAVFWVARREARVALNELRAETQDLRAENERLRAAEPTGNNPIITLELKDGDQIIALDDRGELRGLESSTERQYRQSVKEMLETGCVALPPIVAQLRSEPEIMMGNNANMPHFRLLGPVGVVVESGRPTFRWEALSDAIAYEVSVSDDRGEVVRSPPVSTTDWRPSTQLVRGRVYHWQVRAMRRGSVEAKSPPVGQPDAKFSILERNKLDQLNWGRNAYSGSHLMLGTIYASAGLIDQAEREFRAFGDENPESDIPSRMLESLKRRNQR